MKDELNEFTMQYNMDWINTNSNFINLSDVINNIKYVICIYIVGNIFNIIVFCFSYAIFYCRNKNIASLSAIRSAEDTLQELRNKLKQTEIVLRDRKKIKENEFFRSIS